MRVNLRGADVGMSQQFLDDTQIRAMLQQMRGKAVAQHMESDVPADPRMTHTLLDAEPKCDSRKRRASPGQKHIRWRALLHQLRASRLKVMFDSGNRLPPDRHNALLIPFA